MERYLGYHGGNCSTQIGKHNLFCSSKDGTVNIFAKFGVVAFDILHDHHRIIFIYQNQNYLFYLI